MLLLLALHPALRRVYENLRPISTKSKAGFTINGKSGQSAAVAGEARLEQRASYDFGFALVFLTALHGFSVFKVVLILYTNYCIATKLPKQYVVAATWIFNVGTLFANELGNGYKYTKIEELISPYFSQSTLEGEKAGQSWGPWLDSYGGIMPRWEILFNITVLRLISFNLDYYWSLDRRAGSPLEVRLLPSFSLQAPLILLRRNNSTPPTSRKTTASAHPPQPKTTLSATTSPTPSTPRSTSLDQSSPSTTTSLNPNTPLPQLSARAPPSMGSASSSAFFAWS
jgi:hypothetical protein